MKFFCFHRKLMRHRANKASENGIKYRDKAIVVDKWNCLIYVQCINCGKVLDIKLDDNFIDRPERKGKTRKDGLLD